MEFQRRGRVWKFGDSINTDLIFPNTAFRLPVDQQYRSVFAANRPGWVDQVQAGDIVVAGADFGMGSGRPVGRLLRECGIAALLAESINGLCLRNCVTYGFPALSVPGVTDLFEEGDLAAVDFAAGTVRNETRGREIGAAPLPELFLDLMRAGGSVPMLIAEGWIEPDPAHIPAA